MITTFRRLFYLGVGTPHIMLTPSIHHHRQSGGTGPLGKKMNDKGNANIWLAVMLLMGALGLTVGVMTFRGLPDSNLTWQGVAHHFKGQFNQLAHKIPGFGLGQGVLDRPVYSLQPGQSVEAIQKMYVTQRAVGDEAIAYAKAVMMGTANGAGSGSGSGGGPESGMSEFDPMPVIDRLTELRERMPGLEDILLYRIAELYATVPSEWQVQRHLTRLIESFPDSALIPLAKYRLAESYYRGQQYVSATQWFHQVKTAHQGTPYSVGALYYLGELALKEEKSPKAHWIAYLKQSPDGRFAQYIASQLNVLSQSDSQVVTPLTVAEHESVGVAFVQAELYKKALPHLLKVNPANVWPELAKAYFKTKQPSSALTVMNGNIAQETDGDKVSAAIEMAFRTGPKRQVVPWAKQLLSGADFSRKDTLYFWLAQMEPLSSKQYYNALLTQYPQSVYAPSSHLKKIWPTLIASIPGAGNADIMAKLEHHLDAYGYARSAPTAAFWLAKFHEAAGHTEEAVQRYRQVSRDYPYTYYGFRAAGRLQKLLHGKQDPHWLVTPNADYPDEKALQAAYIATRQEALMQLPEWNTLSRGYQQQLAALAEMPSPVALADMMLILNEVGAQTPERASASAMLISWQAEAQGNYPKALRSVRDDLAQMARSGDMQGFQPSTYQLKQMYPVPHWATMQARAQANGLDPFVSQSLMREESYFNARAISSSNALGLMQLLPATAREVAGWEKIAGFSNQDLFVPETNIQLGTRYLGHLFNRFKTQPFGSMLAVGAYNGGPNAMARWVGDGALLRRDPDAFVERIPYEQTRTYIKKVYTSYWIYRMLYAPS